MNQRQKQADKITEQNALANWIGKKLDLFPLREFSGGAHWSIFDSIKGNQVALYYDHNTTLVCGNVRVKSLGIINALFECYRILLRKTGMDSLHVPTQPVRHAHPNQAPAAVSAAPTSGS